MAVIKIIFAYSFKSYQRVCEVKIICVKSHTLMYMCTHNKLNVQYRNVPLCDNSGVLCQCVLCDNLQALQPVSHLKQLSHPPPISTDVAKYYSCTNTQSFFSSVLFCFLKSIFTTCIPQNDKVLLAITMSSQNLSAVNDEVSFLQLHVQWI